MPGTVRIRPERAADREAVREVHTRAFGDGGRVADLVDALTAARAPLAPVSLVAFMSDDTAAGDEVVVVGHVLISASRLDAPQRIVDVYVLSPLGVLPGFQRRGIGTALVARAIAAAARTTAPLLFLEGSPAYYGSRGFERADSLGFRRPSLRIPPAAFQVARLPAYEPWMTGTLVYSGPFWALDCVGLRGEAQPGGKPFGHREPPPSRGSVQPGRMDLMPNLSPDCRAVMNHFVYSMVSGLLGYPLLESIDYRQVLLEEGSAAEQATAIFCNVLELAPDGSPVNANESEIRAAQYIRAYCDQSYQADPPFEDWELDRPQRKGKRLGPMP